MTIPYNHLLQKFTQEDLERFINKTNFIDKKSEVSVLIYLDKCYFGSDQLDLEEATNLLTQLVFEDIEDFYLCRDVTLSIYCDDSIDLTYCGIVNWEDYPTSYQMAIHLRRKNK